MKKTFSALMAIMMVLMMFTANAETAVATQEPAFEYDFKTFLWGASKEEVIAVEGIPDIDSKRDGVDAEFIGYETEAVGLDVALTYSFCDDGLYDVTYMLTETHSNEELYIDDYNTFKKALIKKYGEPMVDVERWSDDSKKEYYADRKGDALCYGYLQYVTLWSLDRTALGMMMSADNYEISTIVVYLSKEISPGEADFSDDI